MYLAYRDIFKTMNKDTYKHKGLRKKLVEHLRSKGIKDKNVLEAINLVPRHLFIDQALEYMAYEDKALPINEGQTISQPYTVAFQTQLLEIKKNDKVLEIGTGSGYQSAILYSMGAKVFSIERQRNLYLLAKNLLSNLAYKVKCYYGDGYKGLPAFAPFDKILITAAAPEIPVDLIKQLKEGGYMVLPLSNEKGSQDMIRIKKEGDRIIKEKYGTFCFVPLLRDKK